MTFFTSDRFRRRIAHLVYSRGEKGQDFYDKFFKRSKAYNVHYTQSPYYAIWTVVIDRIRKTKANSVLDIGCGPGQFAQALFDTGLVTQYQGLDLSSVGIALAREFTPSFHFKHVDVFETDIIETAKYDIVISLEFLEHVTDDLKVLERIPKGVRIIATVPNYSSISHVRHFSEAEKVYERYNRIIQSLDISTIRTTERGAKIFLMEGVKR